MKSVHKYIHNHESHALPLIKNQYSLMSQDLPPIKNQQTPPYLSPLPNSGNGFPILALAVLGIMATAFLLIGYYVFVTKCCLNWQQIDLLRHFSIMRSRQREDPLTAYSPSWQSRGLDELLIREIPSFQYVKSEGDAKSLDKCVVCLNEFQENDILRVLPSCKHGFHLDCIDIWLQSNDNCPICRLSISGTTRYPIDRIVAPNSSPQDPQAFINRGGGFMGSDDQDFVVIELSEEILARNDSRERLVQTRSHSPIVKLKSRKLKHASIMGDECINVREKDDQFSIQPIRRSFSMDSAADRHIYLPVQEIIRQNRHHSEVRDEACSSRVRRPFFSFGHGRGSRSSVLPVEF